MTTDIAYRWLSNDFICITGGTAWGLSKGGRTFAIGTAAEVEAAIRSGKAPSELRRRLSAAGVLVTEEIETTAVPSAL